jgi:hypothetical protein
MPAAFSVLNRALILAEPHASCMPGHASQQQQQQQQQQQRLTWHLSLQALRPRHTSQHHNIIRHLTPALRPSGSAGAVIAVRGPSGLCNSRVE